MAQKFPELPLTSRVGKVMAALSFDMKSELDERQYECLIAFIDRLVDEGAVEDNSPLKKLFELAFDLAYEFEREAYPLPSISEAAVMRFLKEQHGNENLRSWRNG